MINISIHDFLIIMLWWYILLFMIWLKNYSCQCFQQQKYQCFWCFNIHTSTHRQKEVVTDKKKIKMGTQKWE